MRVYEHGLRHTHTVELRAEGIDIAVIKRQLGHTSLLTTIRYLDHLEPDSFVPELFSKNPILLLEIVNHS